MAYLPVIFLAIAAAGGTVLAAVKYRGGKIPMAIAVALGVFTVTGLVILAVQVFAGHSASYSHDKPQRNMSAYVIFCDGGGPRHDTCGQELPRMGNAGGSGACTWYYCDGGADNSDYKCYHGQFKSGDGFFSNSVRGRGFGRVNRRAISYQEKNVF